MCLVILQSKQCAYFITTPGEVNQFIELIQSQRRLINRLISLDRP